MVLISLLFCTYCYNSELTKRSGLVSLCKSAAIDHRLIDWSLLYLMLFRRAAVSWIFPHQWSVSHLVMHSAGCFVIHHREETCTEAERCFCIWDSVLLLLRLQDLIMSSPPKTVLVSPTLTTKHKQDHFRCVTYFTITLSSLIFLRTKCPCALNKFALVWLNVLCNEISTLHVLGFVVLLYEY